MAFGRRTDSSAPPPATLSKQDAAPPRGLKEQVLPLLRPRFSDEALDMLHPDILTVKIGAALRPLLVTLSVDMGDETLHLLASQICETLRHEREERSRRGNEADGDQPEMAIRTRLAETMLRLQPILMERIDPGMAVKLPRELLSKQLNDIIREILIEEKLRLTLAENQLLLEMMLDEMLGLGPLEPLIADDLVTDILVNGAKQIYVERKGKLVLSDVQFRDNQHVMNIATRIVSSVGRRIDESTPMCDARLLDGSRVNVIIPPLALDGPSISIRKFPKRRITLDIMAKQGNISPPMATVMKIAARSALNIVVSGGTGSGKTTLLNALSAMIDAGERIVTIEDAAELQLQQPHVVRLETRNANLEGKGAVHMGDLLKNALRMRPDRVILGEVRGGEAFDMLQAMNTGHDGSLCTVHANGPREALSRLENMVCMSGTNLPQRAIRTLIASAVDMIVQISRMRDGVRRIVAVTEVCGMEEDIITTQDLFTFDFEDIAASGAILGNFTSSGLRPAFLSKAAYYGLDKPLLEAMSL